jgi:hypothetical protein
MPNPLYLVRLSLPTYSPNTQNTTAGGKLTSHTDPGPAIKRDPIPTGHLPPFESLGPEFLRVLTPEIFTPVQHVDSVLHTGALTDVDGGFTVGATTGGESAGFVGHSGVEGDSGVEAEDLGHDVLEVRVVFELLVGRRPGVTYGVGDRALEFIEDLGMAGEEEKSPGEEARLLLPLWRQRIAGKKESEEGGEYGGVSPRGQYAQ